MEMVEDEAAAEKKVIAVAVKKNSNSKYAITWALDQFMTHGHSLFIIHIRKRLRTIPTPLGSQVPIENVSEEAVAAYRNELDGRVDELLLPFVRLCKSKKVEAKIIVKEDDDEAAAIVREISNRGIQHLVMGASSRGIFGRFKGLDTPGTVSQNAPLFCSVYVISKGRLTSVRSASGITKIRQDDDSGRSSSSSEMVHESSAARRSTDTNNLETNSQEYYSEPEMLRITDTKNDINQAMTRRSASISNDISIAVIKNQIPQMTSIRQNKAYKKSLSLESLGNNNEGPSMPRSEGKNLSIPHTPRLPSIRETAASSEGTTYDGNDSSSDHRRSQQSSEFSSSNCHIEGNSYGSYYLEDQDFDGYNHENYEVELSGPSWNSGNESSSEIMDSQYPQNPQDIIRELERLKIELKQTIGMYAQAREQTVVAKIKANEVNLQRIHEGQRHEKARTRQEKARTAADKERMRRDDADKEKQAADAEAQRRNEMEKKAVKASEKRRREREALSSANQGYRKYTFEEIQQATDCFSESLKIGEGGYGAVYKGYLQHTMVAIKVLRDEAAHGIKQFHKEVEVLSQIRHPHMVMLMGACAEHGCLVYEYMANGSLDERLQRKGNSKALPWQARFRVAWEIASALNFLHTAKPKPIVHRDLKPGNILLDANNVSKIGDVGLARLAPSLSTTTIMTTEFKTTVPAGTFCYIDPEYQRTGTFSPKSDLYAFGIMVLQLITAKPPMALTDHVEIAIEDNEFEDILDKSAGEWPVQETLLLANMALKCAELRRRDRPDLEYDVLPLLSTLQAMALHSSSSSSSSNPSTAFLCPISKEVMEDPQVAADGFTYEYNSIKTWLDRNNTSPMTNLTMPHKNLIPNLTLRSAILEWKSKKNSIKSALL